MITGVCVCWVLKAELNGLRNTVLGVLDYPAELVPVINRLNFAQCAYLLSVYRLETLRFVCENLLTDVCVLANNSKHVIPVAECYVWIVTRCDE